MKNIKFYDAHLHFIYNGSPSALRDIFVYLEKIGLAGFDALVIAEYPSDIRAIQKMVPEEYQEEVSLEVLSNQTEPFPLFNQVSQFDITTYIDSRFIETNIDQKIKMYRDLGFKGIKVLYVPEEDSVIKLGGMEQAFGRSREQSERISSLLIESASAQGMSILIHADLRRYGDFVSEMIKGYPMTNFNVAHFGFSRQAISPLLERYENCYTDLSSLSSFMRKEPEAYLKFINTYQNRILYGSDAMFGHPEIVGSSIEFFSKFFNDPELTKKVFSKNYFKFHKR